MPEAEAVETESDTLLCRLAAVTARALSTPA